MHNYQEENNPAGMLAMGEKVLTYDPDNSVALVLTATVLSDNLMENDPEGRGRLTEIRKNAGRALQTIDSSFLPPSGASAEQIKTYKDTLRSMAHSAIGIMSLKEKDDAKAEAELKISADLLSAAPDPYIWYHLALAQDHQGKYAEALQSVQKALNYTSPLRNWASWLPVNGTVWSCLRAMRLRLGNKRREIIRSLHVDSGIL